MVKKILIALVVILIIIQFIRPNRNVSSGVSRNDITLLYPVPENVQNIMKTSCNDCHTNNTNYPWYTNIQPVGWWLQNHVNEGKQKVNFSEFAAYDVKKQHHKMEEVIEYVENGEMPLPSYLWIHDDAKLSAEQKKALIDWATQLKDYIAQKHGIVEEKK